MPNGWHPKPKVPAGGPPDPTPSAAITSSGYYTANAPWVELEWYECNSVVTHWRLESATLGGKKVIFNNATGASQGTEPSC